MHLTLSSSQRLDRNTIAWSLNIHLILEIANFVHTMVIDVSSLCQGQPVIRTLHGFLSKTSHIHTQSCLSTFGHKQFLLDIF